MYGRLFSQVINKASELQKKLGDGYVALDVLFVALFEDSDVAKAFGSAGLTKQKAEEAMHSIRGPRKVLLTESICGKRD